MRTLINQLAVVVGAAGLLSGGTAAADEGLAWRECHDRRRPELARPGRRARTRGSRRHLGADTPAGSAGHPPRTDRVVLGCPYPADFPTSKRIEGQLRAVVFTDHSESGTSVRATHTYVVLDGRGARGWWSPAGQRARGCSSYDRRGALRQRTPGPTRGG